MFFGKLSPWVVEPEMYEDGEEIYNENGFCCFRYIIGTDPNKIENRVAFIEKTPRVRMRKFNPKNPNDDFKRWFQGHKGSGGSDGHIPENQLYGYDPKSRQWCDIMLINMGWDLPYDKHNGFNQTWLISEINKYTEKFLEYPFDHKEILDMIQLAK